MNKLIIAGIGAFPSHMTSAASSAIASCRVLLQTSRCYLTQSLSSFESCDDIYDKAYDYDELNELVAQRAVSMAARGDTVFVMPSTPVGKALSKAVANAAESSGITCEIIPSVGYAQAALCASGLCFDAPAVTVDACGIEKLTMDVSRPLIVEELDNRLLAGSAKLALAEYYPDELSVTLAVADKDTYRTETLALSQLDRLDQSKYSHTTCLIVPPVNFEGLERRGVSELDYLIKRLRAPGGCPWDREQTIKSLRSSLLEETYEVAEAIDMEDPIMLCEELGDLLLQVVFLARISDEHSDFTLRDVTTDICEKLVYRHPHVFAGTHVKNTGEVLEAWEKLKKTEKHQTTQTQVLKSVPKPLPALTRSAKVQKKAAAVGFDWNNPFDAMKKVREETDEFAAELESGSLEAQFEEMGDLLFAVVNTARLSGIDPELSLTRATEKFISRFERMENRMQAMGISFEETTLEQLDAIWNDIKHN